MTNGFICIGVITSPHGIHGNVKIKIFIQDIIKFTSYITLTDKINTYTIRIASTLKNNVIVAQIQNINSRTEAEKLRNKYLYMDKVKLPPLKEGEFYHDELIGLQVVFSDKVPYGFVKAIHNFGSCDIIELSLLNKKKSVMLPFTENVFPDINLKEGYLVLTLPEIIGSK
ncbi:16S rRNA processing protein RimM [Neoehrlichia mikurensis]|uniref:Ribosome maturation factor RimM n=1 Tax=Neoehrlichia mikurensis TaxID=89586 RepID=A0A9Q9BZL0_9RICK|nr:ribosome maturation factor RimM [Neoehrlichia mikurensis]QXK91585.1 16S rRNA processing protein RimM [Neoehrlichia mikurensis]QXK92796.1 16S rRNA processing protein RimM [Neoehrlichia mikurensis]QXK93275.1 16S rRNA processing protein RimM [Neoehrlichia mikurensis]UTO55798.1 ribosome maturation factor RimM [Neoehrlichia mikurensis]UTO56712.1 ribosome maturation factor RimM [Neoehrlichia mikurensis]